MSEREPWVGIDVAKAWLDVASSADEPVRRLPNDADGIAALVADLRARAPQLVVLEATGGYETAVTAALVAAGLAVAVVNPRQVRDFAKATGQLAKSDALDARVLALFAARVQPPPRPLPDAVAQELASLLARRRQPGDAHRRATPPCQSGRAVAPGPRCPCRLAQPAAGRVGWGAGPYPARQPGLAGEGGPAALHPRHRAGGGAHAAGGAARTGHAGSRGGGGLGWGGPAEPGQWSPPGQAAHLGRSGPCGPPCIWPPSPPPAATPPSVPSTPACGGLASPPRWPWSPACASW